MTEHAQRDREPGLTPVEEEKVEERLPIRAPVVYEIVRTEGDEELNRPLASLWWSGVAAGLCISFSVVSEGLLRLHLPDAPWRPAVENFGYCVGFLIVVLGRMQLFTENTITPVLSVLADKRVQKILLMMRLWGIVLLANLVGTFIFALVATYGGLFAADQLEAFRELSHHFAAKTPGEMALHGIPAGFLVAVMVWMIPSAEQAAFWVVTLLTYLIALGDFAHVVAGSTEMFLLLVHSEIGLGQTVFDFLGPTLLGNVIGGTALFSMLAYGQVMREIPQTSKNDR